MLYQPKLGANLVLLIETYAEATGLSATAVSRFFSGDDKFYGSVRDGGNFTVLRYDTTVANMLSVWPENATWPPDVPIPDPGAAKLTEDEKWQIRQRIQRASRSARKS